MPDYYSFAQKAGRLVVVELSFEGEIRPMLIPDGTTGVDSLRCLPTKLPANQSVSFTVSVDQPADRTENWGFSSVEFFGWRPGTYYMPALLQHVLNERWPLASQATPEYPQRGIGEFDLSTPIASVDYTFAVVDGAWTLSWATRTGASVQRGSVSLTEDLNYAYVVLRLVDANKGQIKFQDLTFATTGGQVFRSATPLAGPAAR